MIEITLPLPLPEVSPNARCHWSKKSKAVKVMRDTAKVYGMARMPSDWQKQPVTIHAAYYCGKSVDKRVRPRDEDNARACLKAYIDGIVDAGYVESDSAKYVKLGELLLWKREKDHRGRACVVLTIQPHDPHERYEL